MNPQDTPGPLSETPREKFRTPRRPSPPGTSKSSKSTTSKRPASPSVSASARPWKRSSLSSSRAQSTLTQIDFVTQTPHSDDDQLDYLDETKPRQGTNTTNAHNRADGDSDDDADYRPSLRPTNFEPNKNHPTQRRKSAGGTPRASERGQSIRKSMTPKPSFNGKGRRKSTEKPPAKRDKTLTQMDFVRRYITIDDDDDVNMGYILSEHKNNPPDDGQQASSIMNQTVHPKPPASVKRNRRLLEPELDLSTGEPLSGGLGDNQDSNPGHESENASMLDAPVTPQKSRKLEIPSSQSPESPGLAIITSSQFRGATRSPLKLKFWNAACHPGNTIKEESPDPQRNIEDSQDHGGASLVKTSTRPSPRLLDSLKHHSSPVMQNETLYAPSTDSGSQAVLPGGPEIKVERKQKERTVVYETDADSDNSDSENDMNNDPATPSRAHGPRAETPVPTRHSPEPSSDDSQELPLPDVKPSADPNDELPSEAPMSDASMFYQRMQPATQFPFEPIPTLNTQKLSELFPNYGSTQYAKPATAGSSQKIPGPFLQSQTQSQEADQTEVVPESSPVHEQDENSVDSGAVFQRPQVPDSVVQVESSQPVDRDNHGPVGVLSRSQLLTSSVMESVPLPNFWMGSQDSVGEPYSLPDR
ncbi:uncharacterized protein N7443_008800 [Penicillium atrosanguineum]|uniref:uncharacterized protein n=1 Tax=Penicillium atrosanguineum TaxID=1132637 RepID=UPI00239CC0BA|nr:uncharacterized protein N7443_008800 [Penicillium atrosanguineum]KAJ5292847.1 hypothetical protein N7443_008800 [Penicillium atrosanguineum]